MRNNNRNKLRYTIELLVSVFSMQIGLFGLIFLLILIFGFDLIDSEKSKK